MNISLILSTLLLTSIIIILSQRLISLGGLLIISALLVSLVTASISSSWYGFILFLIYITGILVLFGYFLALTPNTLNTANNCFNSYTFIFFAISYSLASSHTYNLPQNNINIENDIISIFAGQNLPLYILLTLLLLMVLIIVVTLTHNSPSPLRHYI